MLLNLQEDEEEKLINIKKNLQEDEQEYPIIIKLVGRRAGETDYYYY